MVRKRVLSMLLAFSLMVLGLPVTTANAAEIESLPEELTEVDDAVETDSDAAEKTKGSEMDGDTAEKTEKKLLLADIKGVHINSSGKAVGSDGMTYNDVAYLSASTVMALDPEVRSDYVMLCDVAAEWAVDGIEDIVIAVDEEGVLNWSCYVPGVMLAETQEELIDGVLASEPEATESLEVEESGGGSEQQSVSDNTTTEDRTEETTTEENAAEETTTEGSVTEETTIEGNTTEEIGPEESAGEDAEDDSGIAEENPGEEPATGDAAEDEPTTEETVTEAATEEADVEDVAVELHAENMDLLPTFEDEQVELANEVNVDVMDLGYGMNRVFNATLPSGSYFSDQLTANEKKVYSVASKRLTAGYTTFEMPGNVFTATNEGVKSMMEAVMRSISVIMLTDTEKVEWFANPGGFRVLGDIYYAQASKKIVKCTMEVDKSSYYNQSLDDAANQQVARLVTAAQEYATEHYPNNPAYGVVEYFDKWICENNYYNTPGGVDGSLGGDIYYYCHSAYGALSKGYGVCESFAKAMSRLLDTVGIPNMYVFGYAFGEPAAGHAWNYVQMPDGEWYMLDSTWNNPSDSAANASSSSTKEYLLSAGDTEHTATGSAYIGQSAGFTFPTLSTAKYVPKTDAIELNQSTLDLVVKQKFKLSCDNKEINNTYATWSSSDSSIAKVDTKGNVTAVAPGTAVITLSTLATAGVEIEAECVVKVYEVKAINSVRTGKATDNMALGINGSAAEYYLDVNVGSASPYTAQELMEKKLPVSTAKNAPVFEDVKCTSSKADVAQVTAQLTGNSIKATVTPKRAGSSNVTITFGGKKATLKVTVGELIDAKMFNVDWSGAGVDESTMSVNYTGKAVAPRVTKKSDAEFKPVKFKTTYLNNKSGGTASVLISGTGKYGGEIRYDFTIKTLPINSGNIEFKLTKASNVYNAGSNPAKATVKYLNGSKKVNLKLNTDYQIVYQKGEEITTRPVDAGEYTVIIEGIGGYMGSYTAPSKYVISPCEINKASVKLTSSNQLMTPRVCATVKLGKNVLPKSDYEIKYYSDKAHTQEAKASALKAKTSYYAVITPKGSNMKNGTKEYTKTFKTK